MSTVQLKLSLHNPVTIQHVSHGFFGVELGAYMHSECKD
jgi:hypothetical protein